MFLRLSTRNLASGIMKILLKRRVRYLHNKTKRMQKRSRKRARLLFAYLGLFVLVGGSVILLFRSAPTCTDGRRNQGEVDIDCGGPCSPCTEEIILQPIEISGSEWVYSFGDQYDFIGVMKNPNNKYGASKFKYRVKVETQDGEEFVQPSWVNSFALPGEEKTLLLQGVELASAPLHVEFELDMNEITWEKFSDFESPDFIINDKQYKELGGGEANFSKIWGMIINRGRIDFEEVSVKAFLRNSEGRLLATNSDLLGRFRAGGRRDFNMFFPISFEGMVDNNNITIEVETNPFDPENFSKVYGKDDEWDEVRKTSD